MSHFYAQIVASARKTVPSARGHKSTGIQTLTQSYNGQIRVRMWHDSNTGEDKYEVTLQPHGYNESDGGIVLGTGTISDDNVP
jgi:hypothetical protein